MKHSWASYIMQIAVIFFLAVSLAAIYLVYKIYQHPKAAVAFGEAMPKKIVFFGDSHVHGRIGEDFVNALQKELPYLEMINLGQNGNTVEDLLKRIEQVKELSPDQIYLLIGSNDVLKCQNCLPSESDFQNNYKRVIESFHPSTKVFVISIPMIGDDENDEINNKVRQYNTLIANISAQHKAKYLPFHEKMAATIKALKTNIKGYDYPSFSRGSIVGMKRYLLGQELSAINNDYGFALTVDGLHLNHEGGQILQSLIIPELPLQ